MVDGICSGIADYLDVDSSVLRFIFMALTIENFEVGILFYITAMIVVPTKFVAPADRTNNPNELSKRRNPYTTILIGIVVLLVGAVLLFDYFNIVSLNSISAFGVLNLHSLGRLALPIIIILIGSSLLMGRENEKPVETEEKESIKKDDSPPDRSDLIGKKRLSRSIHDTKVAGICGGMAHYLGIDATPVRLIFVLLALVSFGMALIIYFACALVIPKETD